MAIRCSLNGVRRARQSLSAITFDAQHRSLEIVAIRWNGYTYIAQSGVSVTYSEVSFGVTILL